MTLHIPILAIASLVSTTKESIDDAINNAPREIFCVNREYALERESSSTEPSEKKYEKIGIATFETRVKDDSIELVDTLHVKFEDYETKSEVRAKFDRSLTNLREIRFIASRNGKEERYTISIDGNLWTTSLDGKTHKRKWAESPVLESALWRCLPALTKKEGARYDIGRYLGGSDVYAFALNRDLANDGKGYEIVQIDDAVLRVGDLTHKCTRYRLKRKPDQENIEQTGLNREEVFWLNEKNVMMRVDSGTSRIEYLRELKANAKQ